MAKKIIEIGRRAAAPASFHFGRLNELPAHPTVSNLFIDPDNGDMQPPAYRLVEYARSTRT